MRDVCKLFILLFVLGFGGALGFTNETTSIEPPPVIPARSAEKHQCPKPADIKVRQVNRDWMGPLRVLGNLGSGFNLGSKALEASSLEHNMKNTTIEPSATGFAIDQFCKQQNSANQPAVIIVSRAMTAKELKKCNKNLKGKVLEKHVATDQLEIVASRHHPIDAVDANHLIEALVPNREDESNRKVFAKEQPKYWSHTGYNGSGYYSEISFLDFPNSPSLEIYQAHLTEACRELKSPMFDTTLGKVDVARSCAELVSDQKRKDILHKVSAQPIPNVIEDLVTDIAPNSFFVAPRSAYISRVDKFKFIKVKDKTGTFKKPELKYFMYVNPFWMENDSRARAFANTFKGDNPIGQDVLDQLQLKSGSCELAVADDKLNDLEDDVKAIGVQAKVEVEKLLKIADAEAAAAEAGQLKIAAAGTLPAFQRTISPFGEAETQKQKPREITKKRPRRPQPKRYREEQTVEQVPFEMANVEKPQAERISGEKINPGSENFKRPAKKAKSSPRQARSAVPLPIKAPRVAGWRAVNNCKNSARAKKSPRSYAACDCRKYGSRSQLRNCLRETMRASLSEICYHSDTIHRKFKQCRTR